MAAVAVSGGVFLATVASAAPFGSTTVRPAHETASNQIQSRSDTEPVVVDLAQSSALDIAGLQAAVATDYAARQAEAEAQAAADAAAQETARQQAEADRAARRAAAAQAAPAAPAPAPAAAPAPTGSVADAIRAWFPDVFDQAYSVAECESSLNPSAVSSGGGNHGLFQINNTHRSSFEAVTGQPWSQVYSAYYNSQFARYLYNQSGWRPWSCQP